MGELLTFVRRVVCSKTVTTIFFFFFQNYAIFVQKLGLKVSENHELYNFAHFRKVEASIGIMHEFMRPLCS